MKKEKGFVLLEILLIIATIGILSGIIILTIKPGRQLGDTRNVNRQADISSILSAVHQYSIDNGEMPSSITDMKSEICAQAPCTGLTDLSVLTANKEYLVGIPSDPGRTHGNGAGYTIFKTTNNRITVAAPGAENGAVISMTR